jgi:two-component system, NarL family, nitrate/nitrite response regulator NarL
VSIDFIHSRTLVVGVLVRNELLSQGLTALLRQVPQADVVNLSDQGVIPKQRRDIQGVDIIVATPNEQAMLEYDDDPPVGARPRVLLLVNDAHLRNLEFVGTSAIDGALLQDELSAAVLDDALNRIMSGQTPMPHQLAHRLMARASGTLTGHRLRPVALTSREHETLALLADGMSNKQIARALGVSSHGAKRLVSSVLIKLGAPNRTTAVVNAIRLGLVESP